MRRKARPGPTLTTTETAIVIQPVLPLRLTGGRTALEKLAEAEGLVRAIFLKTAAARVIRVSRISPGHLLGKGGRDEIARLVEELKPHVVIVNHALTPVQQRNLEKEWKAKVIDRTGLILEIFAERAQTKEGQIQVDLASLQYQRSRLVRLWTHLERQRGGAGFMGGPGETQLEIDRRIIDDKIARLKRDLEQVRRNRDLQRRSREKVPFPIVALVGYTNAGKSTLFNRMTGAEVLATDLLFATLDPSMRRLRLKNGQDVILSDTVGFISDLPTHLVAAFRATLEQVQYADVILHVRDIACPDSEEQRSDVIKTLADLGIDYEGDDRVIEILNKIDLLPEDERAALLRGQEKRVAVSALTGEGTDGLLQVLEEIAGRERQDVTYKIDPVNGEALAWLHARCKIRERRDGDDVIVLRVAIDPADRGRFKERFGDHEHKS